MLNRLSIVLAVALAAPAARAAVIYVPGDQPTIQAGVGAAVDGDEVVVAPGTYVLGELEFIVIDSKNITVRSSGGPEATTVRGGGVFPVFYVAFNNSIIEGFTITDGTLYNSPVLFSGGISILGGSPTILDCIFTDNVAEQYEGGGAIGGNSTASFAVSGCTFSDNVGENAGAIYAAGSATISNCTFQGNSATYQNGGAVNIHSGTIENCTFTNNSAAGRGGAVFSPYSLSSFSITGCVFIGNTASSSGGGVHMIGGSVTDCTFESNVANGSGGGAWLEGSPFEDAFVTGCTFSGNSSANGGGLLMRGGEMADCVFDANTAGNGGGAHVSGDSPLMTQCTFRGNTAGGTGGGMYVGSGVTATLTDTTFCQNTPDDLDSYGVLHASGVVIAINGADCDEALTTFAACCLPDGGCVSTTESSCLSAGGAYQGDGMTCADAACPETCPADLEGDGTVGFADILILLQAWGMCP